VIVEDLASGSWGGWTMGLSNSKSIVGPE